MTACAISIVVYGEATLTSIDCSTRLLTRSPASLWIRSIRILGFLQSSFEVFTLRKRDHSRMVYTLLRCRLYVQTSLFVVDVVILHPPISTTATVINPAAVGAAARLGANSMRRQYAALDENLYRLVPFSTDAYGFTANRSVHFLGNFATSPPSHSLPLAIACAIPEDGSICTTLL